MCGIIGFNFKAPQNSNYLSVADYRGPDDTSSNTYGSFKLGHNRLSIIDLTVDANQPFVSNCGNFVIVFNGEVYNYNEVRKNLEGKYTFKTNSDTEVILYNYIEKKEKERKKTFHKIKLKRKAYLAKSGKNVRLKL